MTLAVLVWATFTAAALAITTMMVGAALLITATARATLTWCGITLTHITPEWWWGIERKTLLNAQAALSHHQSQEHRHA